MRILFLLAFILCSFSHVNAQKELIERLEKQAVEIDSLKRIFKNEIEKRQNTAKENSKLTDTLKLMKLDLVKLDELRLFKKKSDTVLRQLTDSLVLIKTDLLKKDKQISDELRKGETREQEKYEAGKMESISSITNSYKGKTFDQVLTFSTRESAKRDLQIFQNQIEIKQMLTDIEKYFTAKELLDAKFDNQQLMDCEVQLEKIKQKSTKLDKLKEVISSYKTLNNGLKETLDRIKALDNAESVSKMSKDVQKKKFDKILAELSSFIFNYDFNVTDYPYLSDIFLEIFKRKQPNPDADISDLINKL